MNFMHKNEYICSLILSNNKAFSPFDLKLMALIYASFLNLSRQLLRYLEA